MEISSYFLKLLSIDINLISLTNKWLSKIVLSMREYKFESLEIILLKRKIINFKYEP